MPRPIEELLAKLDSHLADVAPGQHLECYLVGRSALNSQFAMNLQTADVDVVVTGTPPALLERAIDFAGKGTPVAKESGLYFEMLPSALPPMAPNYQNRARPAFGSWSVLRVFHLDPHDLLISKLGRFATKDQQDIREICDTGTIDVDMLRHLHESAVWHLNHPGTDDYEERQDKLNLVIRYLQKGDWA